MKDEPLKSSPSLLGEGGHAKHGGGEKAMLKDRAPKALAEATGRARRLRRGGGRARWMLKQVQHDGKSGGWLLLPAVMLNLFQHPSCGRFRFAMEKQPCVYILASRRNGTLYIGVTSDLMKRLYQHRSGAIPGFTSRYGVYRLVRYELCGDMEGAILREKQLKRWHRQWKINLIEGENPDWVDLAPGLGISAIGRDGC